MHVLKKIGLWLCGSVFSLSLFGFAIFSAVNSGLNNPSALKSALDDAGIYDISLADTLAESAEERGDTAADEISFDDPIISNAVEQALPKSTIESSVEQVIDGTFVWLRGESEYPDFTLDFSQQKERFIQAVADGTVARIDKLEPCTLQQLQATGGEIDPLTIDCRPPLDLEAQRQKVVSDLQSNDELFNDPVLSGEEFLQEFARHDTAEVADDVPAAAQAARDLPLYFAVAALIAGIAMVLLADSRRKGIHKVAVALFSTGIILLLIQLVFTFITGKLTTPTEATGNQQLQHALLAFIDNISWQLVKPVLIIAGIYTVTGVLALIILKIKKPAAKPAAPTSPNSPEQTGSSAPELHKNTDYQANSESGDERESGIESNSEPGDKAA